MRRASRKGKQTQHVLVRVVEEVREMAREWMWVRRMIVAEVFFNVYVDVEEIMSISSLNERRIFRRR